MVLHTKCASEHHWKKLDAFQVAPLSGCWSEIVLLHLKHDLAFLEYDSNQQQLGHC